MRELENVLERALALSDGSSITADDLLLEGQQGISAASYAAADVTANHDMPLPDLLETIEKKAILEALEKTSQNKTEAAKLLGVSFRTLRYRLSKLRLK